MAKIKFGDVFLTSYDNVWDTAYYSPYGEDYDVETGEPKDAVYRDAEEGGSIAFTGKGLKYAGEAMVAGVIEKITFISPEGGAYVTVVGEFKAAQAYAALADHGAGDVFRLALKGDDKVIGSYKNDFLNGLEGKDKLLGGIGDDWLSGHLGNDRLTGGKGSDLFMFSPGEGQDVITDFHPAGGEGNQDFLFFAESIGGFEKHRDGRNTVFEFDGGGRLTILDVRPGEITDEDFSSP